ncbi:hypothetical protein LTR33_013286 [Friedmanniomyces endolithicus]|nr:hypothetical protein LTR33_013286 [Friedmanniomyces endolithicus]
MLISNTAGHNINNSRAPSALIGSTLRRLWGMSSATKRTVGNGIWLKNKCTPWHAERRRFPACGLLAICPSRLDRTTISRRTMSHETAPEDGVAARDQDGGDNASRILIVARALPRTAAGIACALLGCNELSDHLTNEAYSRWALSVAQLNAHARHGDADAQRASTTMDFHMYPPASASHHSPLISEQPRLAIHDAEKGT